MGTALWVGVVQGAIGGAESSVKQHRGSVGVRWDGDVDDEDALVGYAALQRDCGGLHLEPHQSWSVQTPQGEDDPPAGLISNAKHPAHNTRLWLLLKYGKGRALLQDSWLRESRQSHHIVISWDAGGESEQLVLQEQRRASCGTVQRAGPVTGPVKANRKDQSVTDILAVKMQKSLYPSTVQYLLVMQFTRGFHHFDRMQGRVYPGTGILLWY